MSFVQLPSVSYLCFSIYSSYPHLRLGTDSVFYTRNYALFTQSSEKNACEAGPVCLSVRVIQLENSWTDLDEI